jgi:hypothetical protein
MPQGFCWGQYCRGTLQKEFQDLVADYFHLLLYYYDQGERDFGISSIAGRARTYSMARASLRNIYRHKKLLSVDMYRKLLLFFVITLLVISSGCTTPVADSLATVQPTLPATGSLELSSVPPQSEIYLDGVYRGTTPSIIPDVSTGTHTLEFRSREYHSWSASVVVQGGIRSYINATLSPVVTQTPVPTTEPTPVPTTPVPKTVAGCWKLEHTVGNTTYTYMYDLKASGTGWMYGIKTTPTTRETPPPESVLWSIDPNTMVVTIVEANPPNPADPNTTVLTYDENADILDGGGKGMVLILFVRVPCWSIP